jgi:hypothetical protein
MIIPVPCNANVLFTQSVIAEGCVAVRERAKADRCVLVPSEALSETFLGG